MRIETVLTPAEVALLPKRDLRATTCVVFDVLRATSTILTALFNGARRVHPAATLDEARALHGQMPGALLGGERDGIKLPGFDLGNSPREYTAETVAGRDIVTTTTNGTVALRACAGAGTVWAGALLNLRAVAAGLRSEAVEHLVLVCAGTGPRFAQEDGLAAGALTALLVPGGNRRAAGSRPLLDDATLAMLALHRRWRGRCLAALSHSENGRRLAEIGLDGDVEWCARESPLALVGVLRRGYLEGRSVHAGSVAGV